ncbi:hypothetical protein O1611_g7413 [Lasiodiplodia mahajangana]|uniref:Uncharacterized protein n=1 Tax=Lasiodiplodia mahajangana TaxID=1108764 RepID=A0ACC2JFG4_9PEZI|nr:hypothetical protein O1611_g7413 [Lasiodiplodia mahajangana]
MNGMVYYECMKNFWAEDREEPPTGPQFQSLMLTQIDPNKKFSELSNFLRKYTRRQATYQRDIVNAIISVIRKILGESHGRHRFGVPLVAFESFLCFHVVTEGYEYLERRETLPSWSWSAWRGPMGWTIPETDPEVLEWIAGSTWIVWYIRDLYQPPTLIWDVAGSDKSLARVQTEQILAGRLAKIRQFSAVDLPTLPSRDVPRTYELQRNLLQFWTFSASFNLRVDRRAEAYLKSLEVADWKVALNIHDEHGKCRGFIYVDEEIFHDDHDEAELIVISKNPLYIYYDYDMFYHRKRVKEMENAEWYGVLYVVEKSGIAERKGFGHIYGEEFRLSLDSEWDWKEIILG